MKEVASAWGTVCLLLNEYTAANMPRSHMMPDKYHLNNLGARYVADAIVLLLKESSSDLKYYFTAKGEDTMRCFCSKLLRF